MSTLAPPTPAPDRRRDRPGLRMLRTELVLLVREPALIFWVLGLPLLLLVIFGLIPAFRDPVAQGSPVRVIDAYLPVLAILALGMAAFNAMPSVLATYRERGVLRRLSTTPVPPARLLQAQATIYGGLVAIVVALLVVVAHLAFAVPLPDPLLGFVGAGALAAAAFVALGTLVAAVARTARQAAALGTGLFFPLMFFGGLWLPRDAMPDVLRTISDWTPTGAAAAALQDATQGAWPSLLAFAVLAGWALLGGVIAARLFRWE